MRSPLTRTSRKHFAASELRDASLGVGSLVPRSVGIGSKATAHEVEITCSSDALPRIMPQVAEARCHGYEGPVKWHRFKAWKLRLDFHLVCEDQETIVSCWFHLGEGELPKAGRGSKYRAAWIMANDGEVPRRNDRLSPTVFVDKFFKVRIGDAGAKNKPAGGAAGGEVYSVIQEILEKTGP